MRCVICFSDILPQVNWGNFWKVQKERKVCTSCLDKLLVIDEPGCTSCGRIDSDGICYDCKRWEQSDSYSGVLAKNVSVFAYNDFARELVARWKYRGDFTLVEAFTEALQTKYNQHFHGMEMDLVAIPLSEERLWERGFNQSEAIVAQLGESHLNLFKRKDSEKQSKRGRSARMAVVNPFVLEENVVRPVVLVDDIYTTGMTVRLLARLLRDSGCPSVYSLTLFR
ncbi:ComF family protein [Halobacillus seohaensis]|uniref:ComF family protein n=1 Tax=Halobacillus seohaensis TaxID=447421 RepID=A0ABW2EPX9_9BACI